MPALKYRQRKISEIDINSDTKVAVIGKVAEIGEGSFILDDGSAKAEISFEGAVKTGSALRIFCSIVDGRLKADIVQNMENLDMNLFKRVNELYNRVGL